MNGSAVNAEAPAVSMTPELLQALAGLHDLQVDFVGSVDGVSLIPLLVVGGLFGLLAFLALVWSRQPRQRYRRRLRQLEQAYRQAGTGGAADPAADTRLVVALSALLRQAAVASRRAMPPGLAGDAWLSWLDERAPAADRGAFVDGVGRELVVWPFAGAARGERALAPPRATELIALTERWLLSNA